MYVSDQRIFGPLTQKPQFQGSPLQSGQGLGSWIKGLFKKILPIASKGIMKVLKSDALKETGKKLLDHGLNASTTILANAIDPNVKSDPILEAKSALSDAREDVANIIRKNKRKGKKEKSINENDDDEDYEYSPILLRKKRKSVKYKTKSKKKQQNRRYNLFEDVD